MWAARHPAPGGLQPSLCSCHPHRTVTCTGATRLVRDEAKWPPGWQNDANRRLTHLLDRKIFFFLLITVIKVPNTQQPGSGLSYLYGSHHSGSPALGPAPWPGSIYLPSRCRLPTQPMVGALHPWGIRFDLHAFIIRMSGVPSTQSSHPCSSQLNALYHSPELGLKTAAAQALMHPNRSAPS